MSLDQTVNAIQKTDAICAMLRRECDASLKALDEYSEKLKNGRSVPPKYFSSNAAIVEACCKALDTLDDVPLSSVVPMLTKRVCELAQMDNESERVKARAMLLQGIMSILDRVDE